MIQTADNPAETLEGGEYRASDILKLVGLTYRQLHDWEERAGVMASERATAEGWRKFGAEEVIALAVCAAVRRQFALPLEQTRKLYRWLVGKRPSSVDELVAGIAQQTVEGMESNPKIAALLKLRGDDLRETLKDPANSYIFREYVGAKINLNATRPVLLALHLARIGSLVYLYTDFDSYLILTERNLVNWIAMRPVKQPAILCPLNDIFNAVLEKAGKPKLELDRFAPSFLATWQKIQDRPDLTAAERKVIDLIRERDYQRLTAHVKGGDVIRVEREEELSDGDQAKLEEKILAAINSGDHQSVIVEKRDGKVVRIGRKTSIRLDR